MPGRRMRDQIAADPKMATDLYQIIYASVATRQLKEDELRAMLHLAREKNTRLGITGMLLHCDGAFIQALEGHRDQVKDLFQIIRQDSRHKRITVLFEGPIHNRIFSQWSMGFNRPTREELAQIDGYSPYLDLGEDPELINNYSGVALKLLGAFRDLLNKKSSSP